nr:uncharacterized protein LOC117991979 [Maniola hyperantus]
MSEMEQLSSLYNIKVEADIKDYTDILPNTEDFPTAKENILSKTGIYVDAKDLDQQILNMIMPIKTEAFFIFIRTEVKNEEQQELDDNNISSDAEESTGHETDSDWEPSETKRRSLYSAQTFGKCREISQTYKLTYTTPEG